MSQRRNWEGFHGLRAAALVEKLNRDILGEQFFADMQVHIGSQVEVDVATLDEHATSAQNAVATATLTPVWSPPATSLIVPTVFPDEVEVQVFATATGATLVGAIELVSPGNKDRAKAGRFFWNRRQRRMPLRIDRRGSPRAIRSRFGRRRYLWAELCRRCHWRFATRLWSPSILKRHIPRRAAAADWLRRTEFIPFREK
ncbi:MAG TPA: hypothetical protein VJ783_20465 [Pirellulales bacterium]|nr:hypothetical protein [Pirellulales bacterium]